MNLLKSKLSVAIAVGLLSGSALAAEISCPITPAYSIITEGQTLQLTAECTGGVLASIDWKMGGVSVTGVVDLTDYAAGNPIKYTTPVGLGDANETQEFTFTVVGVPAAGHTFAPGSSAKVVVKPSSAVVALAKGVSLDPAAPTKKVDATCGTADGATVEKMPTSTACASGSKVALPITGPQYFSWSCLSLTGGAEASCYAMRQGYVAPVEPTTTNGTCGSSSGQTLSVKPTTNLCGATTTTPVVATGSTAYTWTCTGSNTAVTSDDASCSATIATVSNPPSSSSGDPGIGSGLWVPPNTTNRTVADQSGSSSLYTTSYVPGCLNGSYITTASSSGCGGNASYTGKINGVDHTFSFGSDRVLSLRYQPKANAGSTVKYFTMASGDGGGVGQSVKLWLSTNPAATYAETNSLCKLTSTTQPYVITGPGYCQITPDKIHYLHISISTACTTCRYKVDEGSSDFQ